LSRTDPDGRTGRRSGLALTPIAGQVTVTGLALPPTTGLVTVNGLVLYRRMEK